MELPGFRPETDRVVFSRLGFPNPPVFGVMIPLAFPVREEREAVLVPSFVPEEDRIAGFTLLDVSMDRKIT
jgi:hypothetical protein